MSRLIRRRQLDGGSPMAEVGMHHVVGTPEELAAGRGEIAVTITQAAARLGVSEKTLREWVEEGRIAPVGRCARIALFRTGDVEKLR